MVSKVTKDVIVTGVKGFGQDYLGAVKGALTVASQLAYPVCRNMGANGLYGYDPWFDEELWYFPSYEEEGGLGYEPHYYGEYDDYLSRAYYGDDVFTHRDFNHRYDNYVADGH